MSDSKSALRGFIYLICAVLMLVSMPWVFGQGEIRQAIPHGVTTPWYSHIRYADGDAVVDRGGVWQAVTVHSGSRPVSGNANWELVAGAAYVETTVTANQFNNLGTTPIELVPAPGANKIVMPTLQSVVYNAGSCAFSGEAGYVVGSANNSENFAVNGSALVDNFAWKSWLGTGVETTTNLPIRLMGPNNPAGGGLTQAGIAINAAGSGYSVGESVTVDGGSNGILGVATVDGSGAVTSFTVTQSGSGYATGTNVATSGPSGTGLTVNITSVCTGDGSFVVRVYYQIIAVS